MGFLDPHAARIYALMRMVVGFLFACHGAQKLFGVFGGSPMEEGAMRYAAGVIELVGGAFVALGFQTRIAAFLSSGTMAVAYFLAHHEFSADKFWPIQNHGELAAVYCWVFLMIAARGAGVWSLDGDREA